ELIDDSVLLLRIILRKIILQPFEELALSVRLALQAKAYERGNCLTHASVHGFGVPFDLAGEGGGKADTVPRPGPTRLGLDLRVLIFGHVSAILLLTEAYMISTPQYASPIQRRHHRT